MSFKWVFTKSKRGKGCFPEPPVPLPRPPKRPDAGKGCFPAGPSAKRPAPPRPPKHPHKKPTPNRRGG